MSEYLEVALEAIKAAEEIILKYFRSDLHVSTKSDQSPVTIADKEAENKIREIITKRFPSHVVYGEEGAKNATMADEYVWVVDPIDGTKFFIRGIPLFGTLLALMKHGEIILGVSNIPVLQELMYAEKGEGAFLNGQSVHVSATNELKSAYLSHGTIKYFTQINQTNNLLQLSENVQSARGLGDCWPYHMVAQGKIDIFVEAKMKIWDIAPYVCIIQEAGGTVTQIDGSAIGLDVSSCLASNGLLHNEALSAFRA